MQGKEKIAKKKRKQNNQEIFRTMFNNSWQGNWVLGVELDFVMGLDAGVPSTKRAIAN